MGLIRKISLGAASLSVVLLLVGLISGQESLWKWSAVTAAVGLAIGLGAISGWQGYQFTGWILAAVITAMIFPQGFLKWGDFDLRNRWLLLLVIQTVMFGMGTQMTLKDFTGIVRS